MHVQTVLKVIAEGKQGKRLRGYYHLVYKYAQLYGVTQKEILCPWFMLAVTVIIAHNYNQESIKEIMDLYRDECKEYVNRYFHLLGHTGGAPEVSGEHISGDTASHEGPGEHVDSGTHDYDRGQVAVVRSGSVSDVVGGSDVSSESFGH